MYFNQIHHLWEYFYTSFILLPHDMKLIALLLLGALTACNANSTYLGKEQVSWQTDHDSALKASAKTGKPVFILFEGEASSSRALKNDVLKHPLFIESIDTDFIPLLVKNSKSGNSKDLIAKYNISREKLPAIRFLDSSGKDIIPPKDDKITAAQLLPRMKSALGKISKPSAILPLIEPELTTPSR